MKKHYLLILAVMMFLTPVVAYSKPAMDRKDHTPVDRSKTDTYSDDMGNQPMTDMKDLKSDKMMNKSKTGMRSKKKTGKSISGTKSKKKMNQPMKDMKSDKIMDKPMADTQPENMMENK